MARTSLQNTISIGEPAWAHNFDLYIPYIPGSPDTQDLTFKCQSTSLPGFGVHVGDVALHGVQIPYAGAAMFTQSMSITFLETFDWSTRIKFRRWKNMMRNWRTNSGSYAADYKVDGVQIALWDDIPNLSLTVEIYGFFLETFDEVPLDGTPGASAIMPTATFRYTDHEDIT